MIWMLAFQAVILGPRDQDGVEQHLRGELELSRRREHIELDGRPTVRDGDAPSQYFLVLCTRAKDRFRLEEGRLEIIRAEQGRREEERSWSGLSACRKKADEAWIEYEVEWDNTRQKFRPAEEEQENCDAYWFVLCPDAPVRVGDSWRVDPQAVAALCLIGKTNPSNCGDDSETHVAGVPLPPLPQDPALWLQNVRGRSFARLREIRNEGETKYGVISLDFDLEGSTDLDSWYSSFLGEWDSHLESRKAATTFRMHGSSRIEVALGDKCPRRLVDFQINSDITIKYYLNWSYYWDAPQVRLLAGKLEEEWQGRWRVSMCGGE